jgi:rhodanese-related sulfurtransferase/DNA-binding transcriptional ArsR family regulator
MTSVIHQQAARLGLAMSSPVRLRALNLLCQRWWGVSELAEELGESIAATSAHLKVLRAACMVSVGKSGRDVRSRVVSREVIELIVAAHRAAEAMLPEMREAAREAENDPFLLKDCDFETLAADAARGLATLVDLRPSAEFAAGHLPGAESWPYNALADAPLDALKGRPRIVGYCRGPWCAKARLGVETLNRRGIPARRLRAGVVEWQTAGLPLSGSPPPASASSSRPFSN